MRGKFRGELDSRMEVVGFLHQVVNVSFRTRGYEDAVINVPTIELVPNPWK